VVGEGSSVSETASKVEKPQEAALRSQVEGQGGLAVAKGGDAGGLGESKEESFASGQDAHGQGDTDLPIGTEEEALGGEGTGSAVVNLHPAAVAVAAPLRNDFV
jgi:hypothetical protein